jgi:hypothetical protein
MHRQQCLGCDTVQFRKYKTFLKASIPYLQSGQGSSVLRRFLYLLASMHGFTSQKILNFSLWSFIRKIYFLLFWANCIIIIIIIIIIYYLNFEEYFVISLCFTSNPTIMINLLKNVSYLGRPSAIINLNLRCSQRCWYRLKSSWVTSYRLVNTSLSTEVSSVRELVSMFQVLWSLFIQTDWVLTPVLPSSGRQHVTPNHW